MHEYRLHVPDRLLLPDDVHDRIFLVDVFGTAVACQASWNDSALRFECESPSGYLQLPSILPDGSERLLRTGTLMARPEPYSLPLELARGILHRMSNRFWECHVAGIDMSERFGDSLTQARRAFSRAVTRQHDPTLRSELAIQAFNRARALMANMSHWMAETIIRHRRTASERSTTSMMGRLPNTASNTVPNAPTSLNAEVAFAKSFDTAVIPTDWRVIEPTAGSFSFEGFDRQLDWCSQRRLMPMAGPLVDFRSPFVPDWLSDQSHDRDALTNATLSWITSIMERWKKEVDTWHVTAGMATPQSLQSDIGTRLELTALAIQRVRELDRTVETVVSFDQPFGEYLATPGSVDPLAFAEALVEHGMAPSAFGLELRFDLWPDGTVRRDPVDLFRRLDRWTDLELPLILFLSAPSAVSDHVTHQQASDESQSRMIQEFAPLLLAHSGVRGICWNEWSDASPYRAPDCGMVREDGSPKPALEMWRSLLSDAAGSD